jgi:hypothetical protein
VGFDASAHGTTGNPDIREKEERSRTVKMAVTVAKEDVMGWEDEKKSRM